MKALQKELDELRDLRAREKEREMKRAQNDEEELQILRDRLEHLEDERGDGSPRVCAFTLPPCFAFNFE